MENDPKGREQLRQLGVRYMPVLFKGKQWILTKNLGTLAKFVGVHGPTHVQLPPEELFKKWIIILRSAQRYVCQFSNGQTTLNALHFRARSIRVLGHHIFCIGQAYLECVVNGAKNLNDLQKQFQCLADGTFTRGEEIARYGDDVIAHIEQWWKRLNDKSCSQSIEIDNYGKISVHQLLERCTWHSAHHTRQISDVLERQGIRPNGRLTDEDLAGLPLPKRIWD